jgi:hypothetical protein
MIMRLLITGFPSIASLKSSLKPDTKDEAKS